jgi:hypothetical protein
MQNMRADINHWYRRRRPPMHAGVIPSACLALVLAGCSGATPGTAAVQTAPPSVTSVPFPTAIPSTMSPSPSAAPIPYGTYTGQPIQISTIVASINADKALSADDRAQMISDTVGQTTTTFRLTLKQDAGGDRFIQEQSVDGGPWLPGDSLTYAFSDSHTLVTQGPDGGTSSWDVILVPGGFSLKAIWPPNSPVSEHDRLTVHFIYELSQFTRQP